MKTEQYDWVAFYMELAEKLLLYKDKRKELVDIVKAIYSNTKIEMPTLEENNTIVDIDPFTVFGLFNKNSQTLNNRVKLITEIANQLSITSQIPTSFAGVPSLDNRRAAYYQFISNRNANDIDNLWNMFSVALKYSKTQDASTESEFKKYFDIAINMWGIRNSKLTMGLFWIAPKFYMNLDSRSIWYICDSGKIPESVLKTIPQIPERLKSTDYLNICRQIKLYLQSNNSKEKDYIDLSNAAFNLSEEVNKKNKTRKNKVSTKTEKSDKELNNEETNTSSVKNEVLQNESVGKIAEYGRVLLSNKNVILQGAPGTGKTYITAALSLFIIGQKAPDDISDLDFNNHDDVMKVYEQYRKNGQIGFCTFHQSMDYEDFVEGLRPEVVNSSSSVSYNIKSGIFKEICSRAASSRLDRVDNFDEVWNELVDYLNANDFVMIPFNTKANMRIELSELGDGLTERVYIDGKYKKGEWINGHSLYFKKDTIYNFYRGLNKEENSFDKRVRAIISYMKKQGLKDFVSGSLGSESKNYVLIIDEINRGYASKIFGELITLIERDKRLGTEGHPITVTLPYSKEEFGIPANLFIIGTMNTTDRTTGTLDYALRRRFDFITLDADPLVLSSSIKKSSDVFNDVEKFIKMKKIRDLEISDLMIGHSYFIAKDEDELKIRLNYEVIPLIKEYIKDGILDCPPDEAQNYYDAWLHLEPYSNDQENDE